MFTKFHPKGHPKEKSQLTAQIDVIPFSYGAVPIYITYGVSEVSCTRRLVLPQPKRDLMLITDIRPNNIMFNNSTHCAYEKDSPLFWPVWVISTHASRSFPRWIRRWRGCLVQDRTGQQQFARSLLLVRLCG